MNESLFISCGEFSGERVARWYLDKTKPQMPVYAMGGDLLEQAGVKNIERYHHYSAIGITDILHRLPEFFRLGQRIIDFILKNNCTTVWLVDFSGFHLRLAKRLKKVQPNIKIVYLAPPHCWSWGEWKIKDLRKWVDDIVVLYPFEVAWYAARGLTVRYVGSLVYESVMSHYDSTLRKRELVVFMPGSRNREIASLGPLFNEVKELLEARYPRLEFVAICADSIDRDALKKVLPVTVVGQGAEAYRLMQQATVVITKPGTVTLELGLLGVPAIAVYKPSWLTYHIAKRIVHLSWASLPSIMLNKKIYPEIISPTLSARAIVEEVVTLVEDPQKRDEMHQNLLELRRQFE